MEALIDADIASGRDELSWMTDEDKVELVRKSSERTAARRALLLSWVGGERLFLGRSIGGWKGVTGRWRAPPIKLSIASREAN